LTARRLAVAAEAVLLLAVLVAPWPYGSAGERAAYVLAAALLGALGLWCIASFAAGRGLPSLALRAPALPLVGLLQIALARSAALVWTAEGLALLVPMLGVMAFWSERGRERRAAERLAVAVLAVCTAEALFGAAQSARGIGPIYGRTAYFISSPFGSYVNHNHFAGLMEMGVLLSAGWAAGLFAAGGRSTAAGLIVGAVSLVLAAAHLASRSRAGLVALTVGAAALGALAFAYVPGRARVRAAVVSVAALALIAVFALVVIPAAARQHLATLRQGAADPSGSYRLDVARDTLRMVRDRPVLGWGLAAFADAFPAYKRSHGGIRTVHAENDALEFVAESGLVGLLFMAVLAAAVVRGLHDRLTRSQDRARNGLALGALAGCAALLAHSFADFNLRIPANALVFVSLAGLAAAPRSAARMFPRAMVGVAAVFLMLLATATAWRAAGARAWESVRVVQSPDLKLAVLDPVLKRHPYLAEAQRAEGLAWQATAARGGPLASYRLARAEDATLRALRLRPSWAEAWGDLAWTRYLRGDEPGTRAALQRSRALDPTNFPVGLGRADLIARLDGPAAAVAELAVLWKGNPYLTAPVAVSIARRWTADEALLDGLRRPP
jgi:O-antigen ligase